MAQALWMQEANRAVALLQLQQQKHEFRMILLNFAVNWQKKQNPGLTT
jgi:hypothetical protein